MDKDSSNAGGTPLLKPSISLLLRLHHPFPASYLRVLVHPTGGWEALFVG
jgi:hypothetical protein